jgi:hypothetical protein
VDSYQIRPNRWGGKDISRNLIRLVGAVVVKKFQEDRKRISARYDQNKFAVSTYERDVRWEGGTDKATSVMLKYPPTNPHTAAFTSLTAHSSQLRAPVGRGATFFKFQIDVHFDFEFGINYFFF